MDCKLVFFDLDGTLLTPRKTIPDDSIDAIASLQRLGIEPVIATGRAPYFAEPILRLLGIESVIHFNGAHVCFRGEVIHRHSLDRAALERVICLARHLDHPMSFLTEHEMHTEAAAHPFVREALEFNGYLTPGRNADCWRDMPVFQAYVHCRPGEERIYRECVPELRFLRWHPESICTVDVLPGGNNKAVGLRKVMAHAGVTREQVIAFGDGQNDIEMLALAGVGVAMGNAHRDLLPHADLVTRHVEDGGIRHALHRLRVLQD